MAALRGMPGLAAVRGQAPGGALTLPPTIDLRFLILRFRLVGGFLLQRFGSTPRGQLSMGVSVPVTFTTNTIINSMKRTLHSFGAALAAVSILLLAGSAGRAGTLNFNGSTAYVTVGARPELKLTGTNLTLEAWIKPTGRGSDATEGGVILGREGEYMLARFADGTIRYAVNATTIRSP